MVIQYTMESVVLGACCPFIPWKATNKANKSEQFTSNKDLFFPFS